MQTVAGENASDVEPDSYHYGGDITSKDNDNSRNDDTERPVQQLQQSAVRQPIALSSTGHHNRRITSDQPLLVSISSTAIIHLHASDSDVRRILLASCSRSACVRQFVRLLVNFLL